MCKEDLKSYSVFKLVKKINAGHSLIFTMAWILTIICLFNSTESSGFMFMFMFMLIISVYMIMETVYFVVRIIIFNKIYRVFVIQNIQMKIFLGALRGWSCTEF